MTKNIWTLTDLWIALGFIGFIAIIVIASIIINNKIDGKWRVKQFNRSYECGWIYVSNIIPSFRLAMSWKYFLEEQGYKNLVVEKIK